MRRTLLSMVMCAASLVAHAQSQLIVNTTDGKAEKISLAKKPTVTFAKYGEKVVVNYGGKRKELDVKNLQFDGIVPESAERVIINLDGEKIVVSLAQLKSITSAPIGEADVLPRIIAQDSSVSIYYAALEATHMTDSIQRYMDITYTWAASEHRIDSCTWTNDRLCIPVAKDVNGGGGEYDNVAYPDYRYYSYTALLVPDAVLKEKYGISNLDDLRRKAHELYDPMYPEDRNITDETDRRNALNRFISYHLLPIYGKYYGITAMDGKDLPNNFNRRVSDICDWYETLMPYSIMKFSFPSGDESGLYINRRGIQNHEDAQGIFVRGSKIKAPSEMSVSNEALNGIYHYIDEIVAYDETMQKVVCNDRIRIEATTLSPDFMTKMSDGEVPRGHSWRNGDPYGIAKNTGVAANNDSRCIGFKEGYVRNFDYVGIQNTQMHLRSRSLYFWSYEGDEIILKNAFDVKIKLPSLPAGEYELRFMTHVGFGTRSMLNLYIDDKLVGNSIDFRPGGRSLFNWTSDDDFKNDEEIKAFDKEIHAKGWMKGPGNYHCGWRSSFDASSATMRDQDNTIRRVVGTFKTDGKSNHYLRLEQVSPEAWNSELSLDFIELIPVSQIETEDIY